MNKTILPDTELFFNHISNYSKLGRDDKKIISSVLKFKSFKKWTYYLQDGEICKFIAFILKGSAHSFYISDVGTEHTYNFGADGYWIADLRSFIETSPSNTNIQFLEDSDVLLLDLENWKKLQKINLKFEKYWKKYFQYEFLNLLDRLKLDLHETANEKYRRFKEKYPLLNSRIPQKFIASYLGMSPEFLSKIKKVQSSE
jgi:CRP-like cAMP-binding protein